MNPYTGKEFLAIARNGGRFDPLRVLAMFADPQNWSQHYGGELATGEKVDGCRWSYVGFNIPPYELAQRSLKK